jgi:cell division transport system ATP-binding protein
MATKMTPQNVPVLYFENVTKVYDDSNIVLNDIDLVIEQGEFVSLVGPSGAGKSTLIKMIYAEETPTNGRVFFMGRDVNEIPRKHLPFYRRNIGAIFQDFKLLPQKTVFENVAYALEVDGKSGAEIAEEVPEVLDLVGLIDKATHFPHALSGGEQQRVAIARALIHRPKLIVADEPTGNLDPYATAEIMQLLLEINKYHTTVLLATHNKGIVDRIGKRVIALENGSLVHDQEKSKYFLSDR